MPILFPRLILSLLLLGLAPCPVLADVVTDWNAAMTHFNESLPSPGVPPLELRAYAMAHIAMFNANKAALPDPAGAETGADLLAARADDSTAAGEGPLSTGQLPVHPAL